MQTVAEAKMYLRNNFEKGVDCPCCGQLVKLYKRKLNSGMARILIAIYHINKKLNTTTGWLDVVNLTTQQGLNAQSLEYSKLKYWGLLEECSDLGSGLWRITPAGKMFVEGTLQVPSHIVLYDGRLVRKEGELISISEALGSKFSYEELMGADRV